MSRKGIDLAAGRLGTSSEGHQASAHGSPERGGSYGVGRLGISSLTEPPGPVRQSESTADQERFADPAGTAQPSNTSETPDHATAPPAPVECEAKDKPSASEEPRQGLAARARIGLAYRQAGRKTVLLGAGGMGAVLTFAVVLLGIWAFRDDAAAPQTVSATEVASLNPASGAESAANRRKTPKQPADDAGPDRTPAKPAVPDVAKAKMPPAKPAKPVSPALSPRLARARPQPAGRNAAASGMVFFKAMSRLWQAPRRAPKGTMRRFAATPRKQGDSARIRHGRRPPPSATVSNKPAIPMMPRPPGFKVTGIMRGLGQGPVAIINDKFVRVGTVVKGAKVVRISDFSVDMELNGKRFRLGVSAPAASASAKAQPSADADSSDVGTPQQ